jgi:lysophospholipase L1-like esterase
VTGYTFAQTSRSALDDLGLYIPPGWGTRWKAALTAAKAGGGKATLATIGASSTQGYYASNLRTKGWPGLLRASLQAAYGDGGDGYWSTALSPLFQAANSIPAAAQSAYAAAGNLVSLTGSWSAGGSDYGPGAFYLFCSATATATWSSLRGTTLSVFTIDGGSPTRSNWTYSVDSGAPVTVTDGGGASQTIRRTTISGLSPGTHSLTISYAGPSGYLSVCGVAAENATGVVVNNLARYGSRAANYANVDQVLAAPWMAGPSYSADLTILAHGPNDATGSDSGDTWAKWQRRIMQTIRDTDGADGTADLMIVLPHIGRYDTSTWLYQDYAQRSLGLAHAYGAALVDLWTLGRNSWNHWNSLGYWGNSSNPGAAGSDSVHPSDAGYQHIADTLLPILTT